jgi:hypothetical protein
MHFLFSYFVQFTLHMFRPWLGHHQGYIDKFTSLFTGPFGIITESLQCNGYTKAFQEKNLKKLFVLVIVNVKNSLKQCNGSVIIPNGPVISEVNLSMYPWWWPSHGRNMCRVNWTNYENKKCICWLKNWRRKRYCLLGNPLDAPVVWLQLSQRLAEQRNLEVPGSNLHGGWTYRHNLCFSQPPQAFHRKACRYSQYLARYVPSVVETKSTETLIVPQLVKKFPAIYGTPRFITAFTSIRHLSLSWARSIQSMPPSLFWRPVLTF